MYMYTCKCVLYMCMYIVHCTLYMYTHAVCAHLGVQQEVVWFDVPVDETQCVYGVNGQHRLSNVEPAEDHMTCVQWARRIT